MWHIWKKNVCGCQLWVRILRRGAHLRQGRWGGRARARRRAWRRASTWRAPRTPSGQRATLAAAGRRWPPPGRPARPSRAPAAGAAAAGGRAASARAAAPGAASRSATSTSPTTSLTDADAALLTPATTTVATETSRHNTLGGGREGGRWTRLWLIRQIASRTVQCGQWELCVTCGLLTADSICSQATVLCLLLAPIIITGSSRRRLRARRVYLWGEQLAKNATIADLIRQIFFNKIV